MLFTNKKTGESRELIIRSLNEGDADSFKECITDFYGDGYPYTEYFDRDFLRDMCSSGRLYILCAFTADEKIAGTVGARLSDDFPGSCIMCLRVVKKAFRGMGIASMLRTMMLEHLSEKKEIKSIYVDALAHDSSSQSDLLQFGFVTTGIRLELYKSNVMVPGAGYDDGDRMSQMVMCKTQDKNNAGAIYCPVEHREIVSDIYKRLGVSFEFSENDLPPGDVTISHVHKDITHGSAILVIENAGTDFDVLISLNLEDIQKYSLNTLLCYLNVSKQGAGEAYAALKNKGFFFTGMKPLNADGEYMIMTWIKDSEISTKHIHACDDGEQLIRYVMSSR